MTNRAALRWELTGIAVIFLAGSVLHFVFDWTGHWRPIAWFAAVNESVWEHFKLAFWPGVLYAMVECLPLRRSVNNFWVGKGIGLFFMPVVVAVLFYGYTAVLGHHHIAVDILIFFLAVGIGQWVSYRILAAADMGTAVRRGAMVGLVVMAAVFALFSYWPPRAFLFEDSRTHQYGIPAGPCALR
jgi:hypothetical protein